MRKRIERFICDHCGGCVDTERERGVDTPPLPMGWVAVLIKGEGEGRIYCTSECAIKGLERADV